MPSPPPPAKADSVSASGKTRPFAPTVRAHFSQGTVQLRSSSVKDEFPQGRVPSRKSSIKEGSCQGSVQPRKSAVKEECSEVAVSFFVAGAICCEIAL